MSKQRILFICHNHPAFHPGGTEIFAHGLFRELQGRPDTECLFLACTDRLHRDQRPGTLFQTIGRTGDELVLWTGHFDRFFQSQTDSHAVAPELTELLRDFRPDVVHFHHSWMIGVEALHLVRQVVPDARIVLTLHEYYAICANDGQMVTTAGRLCRQASADACHKCFPKIEPSQFVLRELHIKAMFGQVDCFVAPSRFLKERFIAWGLPAERIAVLPNGIARAPAAPVPMVAGRGGGRSRFGFFGHINRFKGAMLALDAAARLEAEGEAFSLSLHGGDEFQADEFRAEFRDALGRSPSSRHHGRYEREDLPALMAAVDWVVVPSVWWENAPLVIQEAFAHGRPVICADIGGMAEMVRDGVDGLHFRAGDPESLAEALRRAAREPGLWENLAAGIRPPRTIEAAADEHLALYAMIEPHVSTAAGEDAAAPHGAHSSYRETYP